MSDIAIRAASLGKRYRIGALQQKGGRYSYKSLRDSITGAATLPIRAIRSAGYKQANTATRPEDTFWALKDVSLEVKRGEIVGVIGRNGAGKSTLLKVLSRITEPTVGNATICGRVGSLLEVGTGFHPELTGRENVYMNGAILGMSQSDIERQFDSIVSFAEVEKFIDTPVKHYSSGMYLRLAFAVAAHLETEILFIDEVLAVGDIAFQKKCLGKIKGVATQGRTILFVSHSMNSIEQLCSRVVMLSAGHVTADGTPPSVVSRYLRPSSEEDQLAAWINTGRHYDNPHFIPRRFYLADEHGRQLSMPISASKDIWVTVEGQMGSPDPALLVGYAIFAMSGQLLFWCYDRDEDESRWPHLDVGYCRLRSRIPARFLNQGSYRLELAVNFYCREWIARPGVNSPAIYFEIQGGASDSPYWYSLGRDGFLAPIFPWETVGWVPSSPDERATASDQ